MIETTNYKLQKYELDDAANLTDGYNNSMDIIDKELENVNAHFPITSSDIEDGTINTVDIANGAITDIKLAADAVTSDKLAPNSVNTDNIVNGAVTSDKLAPNSISSDKLDASINDTLNNVATNTTLVEEYFNYFTQLGITDEQSASDLHTQIDNTYQGVLSNTQRIDDLEQGGGGGTPIGGGVMLVFGDSWSVARSDVTTMWWEQIASEKRLEAHNFAIGGASFSTQSGYSTIAQEVATANSTLTTEQKENVSEIYILAGVNDVYRNTQTGETLYSLLSSVISTLKTNYPKATIHYAFNQTVYLANLNNDIYSKFILKLPELGIIVHNIFEPLSLHTEWYVSDNLHINQTGNNVVASILLNRFVGGATVTYQIPMNLWQNSLDTDVSTLNSVTAFNCAGYLGIAFNCTLGISKSALIKRADSGSYPYRYMMQEVFNSLVTKTNHSKVVGRHYGAEEVLLSNLDTTISMTNGAQVCKAYL